MLLPDVAAAVVAGASTVSVVVPATIAAMESAAKVRVIRRTTGRSVNIGIA